jgi:hypothetical protein
MYILGDVHGDADRLIKILARHDIISTEGGKFRWVMPNVVVLLMGDVLDARSRLGEHGDMAFQGTLSDLWILEFLKLARREAARMNSDVLAIIGNHELLNIAHEFRWVSPHHVSNRERRVEYFSPGGGGHDAITTLFHTSIRYNGNLYMHAGLPLAPSAVQKRLLDKRVSPVMLRLVEGDELEHLLSHRDYELKLCAPSKADTYAVKKLLRTNGASRMVIGHNYTRGQGVTSAYDGYVV